MKQSKQAQAAKRPRTLDVRALAPVAGGMGTQPQPWLKLHLLDPEPLPW